MALFDPVDPFRSSLPTPPQGNLDPLTPLRMLGSFQAQQAQPPIATQQSPQSTGLPPPPQSYGGGMPSYEQFAAIAS